MRLIDADSLIANMDKGMQGTAREYLKFYQMAVNDEPTAYDADKVVEQITKATYEYGMNCYIDGKPVIAKERAIGFIKAETKEQQDIEPRERRGNDGKDPK